MRGRGAPSPASDVSLELRVPLAEDSHCPRCFREVPVAGLRKHLEETCAERVVECCVLGCGARHSKSETGRHLAKYCVGVRRREDMVKRARDRRNVAPEEVERRNVAPVEGERRNPAPEEKDRRKESPSASPAARSTSPEQVRTVYRSVCGAGLEPLTFLCA